MAPLLRKDVPVEEVWDLSQIFPDEAAFDAAIQDLKTVTTALKAHQETLGQGENELLQFLRARDEALALSGRISYFAMFRFSEDGGDTENQVLMGKAQRAAHQLQAVLTELQSTYLNLPETTLTAFAESTGPLAEYHQYLSELMQAGKYQLHPAAEGALAAVAETLNAPSVLYRNTTGGDLRSGTVPDEEGNEFLVTPFSVMVRSETSYDGAFRKRAYDALMNGLRPYHNTLGVSLSTEIKKNVALARLRGYDSTADMLLHETSVGGFPSDNVSVPFFERVPHLILKNLAPHMQRYARLRAEVWGVPKLKFCDVKAPVVDTSAKKIPFEEVETIIPAAVSVMGDEYRRITERAFAEKWIYRGDNVGALQGAYSYPAPDVHPYVFAPYHGILYDLFILVHELGHSVHGVYMGEQAMQNRMTSRLFVEGPSTFNEHLLGRYLRETGSPETRLQTACAQLFTFHHNFVTHLIEGELLRRLYRMADAGESITTSVLDRTQLEILQEFWGDTVELDDGAALTWMRQAHYYNGLHPYSYAMGLTASTALAMRMERGEDVSQAWIEALRMGGRKHALESFRSVGIEMDSEAPYEEAVAYVGRLIDELEAGLK